MHENDHLQRKARHYQGRIQPGAIPHFIAGARSSSPERCTSSWKLIAAKYSIGLITNFCMTPLAKLFSWTRRSFFQYPPTWPGFVCAARSSSSGTRQHPRRLSGSSDHFKDSLSDQFGGSRWIQCPLSLAPHAAHMKRAALGRVASQCTVPHDGLPKARLVANP